MDEYYKNYAPKIPTDHWEAIGDFVRAWLTPIRLQ